MTTRNIILKPLLGTQEDLKHIFQNYKHPNEDLYFGTINLDNFNLPSFEYIYSDIENYINVGIDMNLDLDNITTTSLGWQLDSFIKLCWLTEEHLNNRLSNPLGAHYNPRLEKNIIHPGGSRQKILKLWDVEKFQFYYFNTTGIQFDWMSELKIVNVPAVCYFVLVADHGSLIPHVHFDQPLITRNVPRYHEVIRKRIKQMKLSVKNSSYDFLEKFDNEEKTNPVIINFNEEPSLQNKIKAFILACLGYSVESQNFTIVNTFTNKKIVL